MFRRLQAVLASAGFSLIVALVAETRHPSPAFVIWLLLDMVLFLTRFAIVTSLMRCVRRNTGDGLFGTRATDLFIIAGTLWSALQGYGALITLQTHDAGLVVVVTFVTIGVGAAQSVRNPSSPRMNAAQMGLILLPLSVGAWLSPLPMVPWAALLAPAYLATMYNLTRQIHDDYVAMIVAQIENRRRALHCALTGLPNRTFFDESLGAAIRDAPITRMPLVVLCIDLDGFKAVNDHFGHPLGDALLIQVAGRLTNLVTPDGLAARLGGDEFAILMRSHDRADADCLAARINQAIAEPFTLSSDIVVTIGASVGILVFDGDIVADPIDACIVMTRADRALYAAKNAGRGTFRRFEEGLSRGETARAA